MLEGALTLYFLTIKTYNVVHIQFNRRVTLVMLGMGLSLA